MNPKHDPKKRRAAILVSLAFAAMLIASAMLLGGCTHTHKYVKTRTVLPTCTEDGYSVYTCTDCDESYKADPIPKLGHELRHRDAKSPTCTEVGWLAHDYCTREGCGYTTKEEIAALRHQFTWHEEQKATCTEIGWKAYNVCDRCGYSTYEEIAALGHDLIEHPRVEPTCTEDGETAYTSCSRCDLEEGHEILEKLGHDIKQMAAQEPTCVIDGWLEHEYCARENCEYTTKQAIPARGYHEYAEEWSTDEQAHWHEATCTDHPDPEKEPHSWNNNVCSVCAYKSAYTQDLAYTLNFDGRSYNVSGMGSAVAVDVIIPAVHNGLPVTGISAYAFKNAPIRSVTVGENVTIIASEAFAYCAALQSVTLSEKLTALGESAFASCSALTAIEFPASLVRIGPEAFKNCDELTAVTLPAKAIELGSGIFGYCRKLHTVILPDALAEIPASMFVGCESLTALTLPAVPAAQDDITDDGTEPSEPPVDPVNPDPVDPDPIDPDPVDPDPVDPDPTPDDPQEPTVKPLGVVRPAGLQSIGRLAFANCTALESVDLTGITAIGAGALSNCAKLLKVDIPETVTAIESSTFQGCAALTEVTLPKGLQTIGQSAFSGCSALTSVSVPDGITAIAQSTFQGCAQLREITLPESMKTIGQSAFGGCYELTTVRYGGAPKDWKTISIAAGNSVLTGIQPDCDKQDPVTTMPLPAPVLQFDAEGKKVTWSAINGAGSYAVTVLLGNEQKTTETITATEFSVVGFTDAGEYTVTVKALPSDTTAHTESEAASINFTVEAEPPAPVTYTITYELDGGTNAAENPESIKADKTVTLESATKEGCTFDGWYTDLEDENTRITEITGTQNWTLYAKFTAETTTEPDNPEPNPNPDPEPDPEPEPTPNPEPNPEEAEPATPTEPVETEENK